MASRQDVVIPGVLAIIGVACLAPTAPPDDAKQRPVTREPYGVRWQHSEPPSKEQVVMPKVASSTAYPDDISKWVDDTWIALVRKEAATGMKSLSDRERAFYVINNLFAEVGNGGMEQYYFNSSGDYATEVVAALQTIGAASSAGLVAACNRAFRKGVPIDRDKRIAALGRLPDKAAQLFAETDDALCRAWLAVLHQESTQQQLIGLHLVETARVLHKLWPRRYPKAELGSSDNKLLNASAFLAKTN